MRIARDGKIVFKALAALFIAALMGPPALAAAAQEVTAVVHPSPTELDYRVNAGDELDISVWGDERLQRAVRVQPDGTLSFPLVGRITAANRTVREIAGEIRENLAPNYREAPPDVTVSVRDATGMKFYVMGKVRTPGGFNSGRSVNVLQALSMAGGLADFADVKNAVILRQTAQGQTVERLRLSRILKGGRAMDAGRLATPLPVLGAGDVLVIP